MNLCLSQVPLIGIRTRFSDFSFQAVFTLTSTNNHEDKLEIQGVQIMRKGILEETNTHLQMVG